MSGSIDLNADLGEGAPYDDALMDLISSCNIACGGHAGNESSMAYALREAKARGVAAGVHPSYPDQEHFGRQSMEIEIDDLQDALTTQIITFKTVAKHIGTPVHHLKPHGALYNDAAKDSMLAGLICGLTAQVLPGAALIGPPASQLETAADQEGIVFIAEGFADRAYADDGTLVPRGESGAILEGDMARANQALAMAQSGHVKTITGKSIPLPVRTICLHGDTPGALSSARAIRAALEAKGLTIKAQSHAV